MDARSHECKQGVKTDIAPGEHNKALREKRNGHHFKDEEIESHEVNRTGPESHYL
jgi:hypothetical protein